MSLLIDEITFINEQIGLIQESCKIISNTVYKDNATEFLINDYFCRKN